MHFSSVTKYLVSITDLLSIKRGRHSKRFGSELISHHIFCEEVNERIEDIDSEWITKAEGVWELSQWVKVFHKMAQESGMTLIASEIEGLQVSLSFFL